MAGKRLIKPSGLGAVKPDGVVVGQCQDCCGGPQQFECSGSGQVTTTASGTQAAGWSWQGSNGFSNVTWNDPGPPYGFFEIAGSPFITTRYFPGQFLQRGFRVEINCNFTVTDFDDWFLSVDMFVDAFNINFAGLSHIFSIRPGGYDGFPTNAYTQPFIQQPGAANEDARVFRGVPGSGFGAVSIAGGGPLIYEFEIEETPSGTFANWDMPVRRWSFGGQQNNIPTGPTVEIRPCEPAFVSARTRLHVRSTNSSGTPSAASGCSALTTWNASFYDP